MWKFKERQPLIRPVNKQNMEDTETFPFLTCPKAVKCFPLRISSNQRGKYMFSSQTLDFQQTEDILPNSWFCLWRQPWNYPATLLSLSILVSHVKSLLYAHLGMYLFKIVLFRCLYLVDLCFDTVTWMTRSSCQKSIKKKEKKGKNLLVPYLSYFILPYYGERNLFALRSLIVIYVNIFHLFCLLHLQESFRLWHLSCCTESKNIFVNFF